MEWKKAVRVVGAVAVLVLAWGLQSGSSVNGDGGQVLYGEAFAWEIKGASVEEVWRITGDFVGVAKWVRTLLTASYRVAGVAQQPGCVRKSIVKPVGEGQPSTFVLEELLTIDEQHHHFSLALLNTTTPGLSLLTNYTSSIKVSAKRPSTQGTPRTLFQWSYVTGAATNLSAAALHDIVYGSLYSVALSDLQTVLSLPNGSISLISTYP